MTKNPRTPATGHHALIPAPGQSGKDLGGDCPWPLTITGDLITSDSTAHTARPVPGHPHAWQVTWLPGRLLDRNAAITAIALTSQPPRHPEAASKPPDREATGP